MGLRNLNELQYEIGQVAYESTDGLRIRYILEVRDSVARIFAAPEQSHPSVARRFGIKGNGQIMGGAKFVVRNDMVFSEEHSAMYDALPVAVTNRCVELFATELSKGGKELKPFFTTRQEEPLHNFWKQFDLTTLIDQLPPESGTTGN